MRKRSMGLRSGTNHITHHVSSQAAFAVFSMARRHCPARHCQYQYHRRSSLSPPISPALPAAIILNCIFMTFRAFGGCPKHTFIICGDWQLPLLTCLSCTVELTPPQEAQIVAYEKVKREMKWINCREQNFTVMDIVVLEHFCLYGQKK